MKTIVVLFITLSAITGLPLTGNAQTYTVTSNGEAWNTLVGGNNCPACTINIPAGWAIALPSTGSCAGCTFNGGSLNITSFSFTGSSTFENDTVNLSSSITFSGATTFTNSTVNFGSNSLTFNSKILTVSNSIFNMPAGSGLTANKGLTSGGSTYNISGSAALTVNSPGTTFNGDNITMSGSATATFNGGMSLTNGSFTTDNTAAVTVNSTFASTNSTLSFNNNSSFNPSGVANISGGTVTVNDNSKLDPGGTLTVTGSTVTANTNGAITASNIDLENTKTNLNDNSTLTAGGTLTVGTGSDLTIGDGTGSAGVSASNLDVTGNSFVGIASGANTLTLSSGKFKNDHGNVPIANSTTGCETLNNSGVTTCVTLEIAEIDLTATLKSGGTVSLSWTDAQSNSADNYLVQRSFGNDDWTTITTVNANPAANGDYHFEDKTATVGTSDYRIVRIGQNGNASYSAISTVSITRGTVTLSIYPNPATGHTFFVTTPNSSPLVVSIFTLTGQLIERTTVQGQTQYPIQLPSQLLPGTAVVVQTIQAEENRSFPLLLR